MTSAQGSAQATGRWAEEAAESHLHRQGLTTLDHNWHCRLGELDLVMRHDAVVVFVEVRYRAASRFGSAAESVDRRKQQRIILAAQYYLQQHPALARRPCRFDVVTVTGTPENRQIQWFDNAFDLA